MTNPNGSVNDSVGGGDTPLESVVTQGVETKPELNPTAPPPVNSESNEAEAVTATGTTTAEGTGTEAGTAAGTTTAEVTGTETSVSDSELAGSAENDELAGSAGNDELAGSAGNDELAGLEAGVVKSEEELAAEAAAAAAAAAAEAAAAATETAANAEAAAAATETAANAEAAEVSPQTQALPSTFNNTSVVVEIGGQHYVVHTDENGVTSVLYEDADGNTQAASSEITSQALSGIISGSMNYENAVGSVNQAPGAVTDLDGDGESDDEVFTQTGNTVTGKITITTPGSTEPTQYDVRYDESGNIVTNENGQPVIFGADGNPVTLESLGWQTQTDPEGNISFVDTATGTVYEMDPDTVEHTEDHEVDMPVQYAEDGTIQLQDENGEWHNVTPGQTITIDGHQYTVTQNADGTPVVAEVREENGTVQVYIDGQWHNVGDDGTVIVGGNQYSITQTSAGGEVDLTVRVNDDGSFSLQGPDGNWYPVADDGTVTIDGLTYTVSQTSEGQVIITHPGMNEVDLSKYSVTTVDANGNVLNIAQPTYDPNTGLVTLSFFWNQNVGIGSGNGYIADGTSNADILEITGGLDLNSMTIAHIQPGESGWLFTDQDGEQLSEQALLELLGPGYTNEDVIALAQEQGWTGGLFTVPLNATNTATFALVTPEGLGEAQNLAYNRNTLGGSIQIPQELLNTMSDEQLTDIIMIGSPSNGCNQSAWTIKNVSVTAVEEDSEVIPPDFDVTVEGSWAVTMDDFTVNEEGQTVINLVEVVNGQTIVTEFEVEIPEGVPPSKVFEEFKASVAAGKGQKYEFIDITSLTNDPDASKLADAAGQAKAVYIKTELTDEGFKLPYDDKVLDQYNDIKGDTTNKLYGTIKVDDVLSRIDLNAVDFTSAERFNTEPYKTLMAQVKELAQNVPTNLSGVLIANATHAAHPGIDPALLANLVNDIRDQVGEGSGQQAMVTATNMTSSLIGITEEGALKDKSKSELFNLGRQHMKLLIDLDKEGVNAGLVVDGKLTEKGIQFFTELRSFYQDNPSFAALSPYIQASQGPEQPNNQAAVEEAKNILFPDGNNEGAVSVYKTDDTVAQLNNANANLLHTTFKPLDPAQQYANLGSSLGGPGVLNFTANTEAVDPVKELQDFNRDKPVDDFISPMGTPVQNQSNRFSPRIS